MQFIFKSSGYYSMAFLNHKIHYPILTINFMKFYIIYINLPPPNNVKNLLWVLNNP